MSHAVLGLAFADSANSGQMYWTSRNLTTRFPSSSCGPKLRDFLSSSLQFVSDQGLETTERIAFPPLLRRGTPMRPELPRAPRTGGPRLTASPTENPSLSASRTWPNVIRIVANVGPFSAVSELNFANTNSFCNVCSDLQNPSNDCFLVFEKYYQTCGRCLQLVAEI